MLLCARTDNCKSCWKTFPAFYPAFFMPLPPPVALTKNFCLFWGYENFLDKGIKTRIRTFAQERIPRRM